MQQAMIPKSKQKLAREKKILEVLVHPLWKFIETMVLHCKIFLKQNLERIRNVIAGIGADTGVSRGQERLVVNLDHLLSYFLRATLKVERLG